MERVWCSKRGRGERGEIRKASLTELLDALRLDGLLEADGDQDVEGGGGHVLEAGVLAVGEKRLAVPRVGW